MRGGRKLFERIWDKKMDLKDNLLRRIDKLLETKNRKPLESEVAEIDVAITHLYGMLYGKQSAQLELVLTLRKQAYSTERDERRHSYDNDRYSKLLHFRQGLRGCLEGLKADIDEGRIVNIHAVAQGEVFGDFIALAQRALNEEQREIAAVLAFAALENALKQCATNNYKLTVEEANMDTVIKALKSKGAISGRQGELLDKYRNLRNDTFHARWNKIDSPEINAVLGFTEEFLKKHFSRDKIKLLK